MSSAAPQPLRPRPVAAPTTAWSMQAGSWSRMPDCHTWTGRQRRSPVERMIQSSSTCRCLMTWGSPSIQRRSKRAPDFESAVLRGRRSHAPPSSSSIEAATGRSTRSTRLLSPRGLPRGLHLRQQRGRPPAPTEGDVLGDTVVDQFQHVGLVASVRNAALFPSEHELHELAVGQRNAAKLVEAPRAGEPCGQLGPHLLSTSYRKPPIRYGCVQHGVLAEDVSVVQVGPLDGGDELVDHARSHPISVAGAGCNRLAATFCKAAAMPILDNGGGGDHDEEKRGEGPGRGRRPNFPASGRAREPPPPAPLTTRPPRPPPADCTR